MGYTQTSLHHVDARTRADTAAFFIALLATALALGAALAHALELPTKLGLDRQSYFVAQRLYDGWNKLGILIAVEFISLLAVIALNRHDGRVVAPAVVALVGVLAAQVVFWAFTFPTNTATDNWTAQPENWEQLRSQWEYSHFAGFVLQLIAFVALAIAVLRRRTT